MKEYSFKALLDYIKEYQNIDYHVNYASDEVYDKYKKEAEELEKEKKRLEDNFTKIRDNMIYYPGNVKVNGPLDGYDSEEAQLKAYKEIYYKLDYYDRWLKFFPTKDFFKDEKNLSLLRHPSLFTLSSWFHYMNEDINSIKENNLDNDEFYEKVDKIVKENKDDPGFYLDEVPLFVDKNISFEVDPEVYKVSAREREIFKSLIIDTDLMIPDNVTCDEEEKPGEDENTDTPTKPDTPEDKDTTTPTTKTTSKQDKPSTKTSTKSSDKSTMSTTTNKEENFDTTTPITSITPTTPNQVKTHGKVNTPNNPINPGQSFTPVKNTNPGTFNGGVSSSVEGEEVSDGSKVDTGSPTTSLLNKIRTIF